jgi:hypothetical protein
MKSCQFIFPFPELYKKIDISYFTDIHNDSYYYYDLKTHVIKGLICQHSNIYFHKDSYIIGQVKVVGIEHVVEDIDLPNLSVKAGNYILFNGKNFNIFDTPLFMPFDLSDAQMISGVSEVEKRIKYIVDNIGLCNRNMYNGKRFKK